MPSDDDLLATLAVVEGWKLRQIGPRATARFEWRDEYGKTWNPLLSAGDLWLLIQKHHVGVRWLGTAIQPTFFDHDIPYACDEPFTDRCVLKLITKGVPVVVSPQPVMPKPAPVTP